MSKPFCHRLIAVCSIGFAVALPAGCAWATDTTFFTSNQVATLVSTGVTSDTISSEGYLFTYTRDKLFTGGVGLTNPIGRSVRVPWPQGIEAQVVTSGPNPGKARITISRVNGGNFDLPAFTFKLLANTAGAGARLEIMPVRNGEDAFSDPFYFEASGYGGMSFTYTTAPSYLGSTAGLTNYEGYKVALYVDFAFTALSLHDASIPPNHAPTGINLSNATILENEPAVTYVGSLSADDPDTGDTHTFALVAGANDTDNAHFSIIGGDLYAETSFNAEVRTNYSIRVEATDQGGLSTQAALAITVLDVNEPQPGLGTMAMNPGGECVLTWESLPNHTYTILVSTNLLEGFAPLAIDLPSTAPLNTYTDSAPSSVQRIWSIVTGP